MKLHHFEKLQPLCPVCRVAGRDSPLELAQVFRAAPGHVEEGVLRCGYSECLHEFPIINGIPLIVPDPRAYVSGQLPQILARRDLSPAMESLIGDCCGPGSDFDTTRQHLSSYARDHYGDLDPEEPTTEPRAGSTLSVLDRALELAGALPEGPVLDVGCAVGRTSFALGERRGALVLGVDLHFSMLQVAAHVLRHGVARYPRRRLGLVYDRRRLEARFPGAELVDFWACDAAALPFSSNTFAALVGLNVIDCVTSPLAALTSCAGVVRPGAKVMLSTPYDWSPGATPVEAWLGGHSQRGADKGAAEPILRRLLTPGAHPTSLVDLRLMAEDPTVPWRVRLHERGVMEYQVHLVVAEKTENRATACPQK